MTGEQKSLVLVTVDCLRADHTGFMGYARPTTPFLDSLAAESFVFPRAISTGAPTYYSLPGIMASRFPLALGREVTGIAPGEQTMATVLREAGYRTGAFVAANPYLSARFGYEQGFEVFEDFLGNNERFSKADEAPPVRRTRTRLNEQIAKVMHTGGRLGRWYDDLYFEYCQRVAARGSVSWESLRRFPAADVLVMQACEWLASVGDQSFFLWLHFMDPHAPYYPSADALKAMGADIAPAHGRYVNAFWNRSDLSAERRRRYRDDVVLLHDAGIRWVDTQIGRLVECLQNSRQWESSVLALTADHGEEFLDHGGCFHAPSHGYQELLRVPLMVRVPGGEKRPLSKSPFSQIHLMPTVLEAMGVEPPSECEGRSYWKEVQAGGEWGPAISESVGGCTNPMMAEKRLHGRVLVVQDQRYKLIVDFDHAEELLFDLDSDPAELRPLAPGTETAARARLLRTALQHLSRSSCGSKELAVRARVHELRLEWSHSKMHSAAPAS